MAMNATRSQAPKPHAPSKAPLAQRPHPTADVRPVISQRAKLDELPKTARLAAERSATEAARLRGSSSLLVIGSFAQAGAALALLLLLAAIVALRLRRRARAGKEGAEKDYGRRPCGRILTLLGRCVLGPLVTRRMLTRSVCSHRRTPRLAAAIECCCCWSRSASVRSCADGASPTRSRLPRRRGEATARR